MESKGIVEDDNAMFGYGEMREGACKDLIHHMQNPNIDILSEHNIKDIESFKLSNQSRFLDIGSGGGKVVMQVALEVGCRAHGIEVLQNRIECSEILKQRLVSEENAPKEWAGRVTFD